MPRVGFEPTISAGERPKTYALDRAATGTGSYQTLLGTNYRRMKSFQIALPLKIKLLDIYKKCNLIYLALILNTGNNVETHRKLRLLKELIVARLIKRL